MRSDHLSNLERQRALHWQNMSVTDAIRFVENAVATELTAFPDLSPTQALISISKKMPRVRGFSKTLYSELTLKNDADDINSYEFETRTRLARQALILVYSRSIIAAMENFGATGAAFEEIYTYIVERILEILPQSENAQLAIPTQYLNTTTQYLLQQYFSDTYDYPGYLISPTTAQILQHFDQEMRKYADSISRDEISTLAREYALSDERLFQKLVQLGNSCKDALQQTDEPSNPAEGEVLLLAHALYTLLDSFLIGEEQGIRNNEIFAQFFELDTVFAHYGLSTPQENGDTQELPNDKSSIARRFGISSERVSQILERMIRKLTDEREEMWSLRPTAMQSTLKIEQNDLRSYRFTSYAAVEREKMLHAQMILGSHRKRLHQRLIVNSDIQEKIAALKKRLNRPGAHKVSKTYNPYFITHD